MLADMTVSSYSESSNGPTSLFSYPQLSETSTFSGYTITGSKSASYFVVPVNYSDVVSVAFSGSNIEHVYIEYRFVTASYLASFGAYGGSNLAQEGTGSGPPASISQRSLGSVSAASAGGYQNPGTGNVTSGAGYLVIEVYGGGDITADALTQVFQLQMSSSGTSPSPPPPSPPPSPPPPPPTTVSLVYTATSTSSSSVVDGGTVNVNYTIKNQGTGTAFAAPLEVFISTSPTYNYSLSTLLTTSGVAQLSPGTSTSGTVPLAIHEPAGQYYLYLLDETYGTLTSAIPLTVTAAQPVTFPHSISVVDVPGQTLTLSPMAALGGSADYSPAGYTLSLSAIQSTSADGASLVINADKSTVQYVTPTGNLSSDSFQYTVSDGHGGAATGSFTINFTHPQITSASSQGVNGAAGTAHVVPFTISLSQAMSVPVTVHYATQDYTAHAGVNYVTSSGTLTFSPGVTSQEVDVSTIGTDTAVGNTQFGFVLSNPTNAQLPGNVLSQPYDGIITDVNTLGSYPSPLAADAQWSQEEPNQVPGGRYDVDSPTYTYDSADGTYRDPIGDLVASGLQDLKSKAISEATGVVYGWLSQLAKKTGFGGALAAAREMYTEFKDLKDTYKQLVTIQSTFVGQAFDWMQNAIDGSQTANQKSFNDILQSWNSANQQWAQDHGRTQADIALTNQALDEVDLRIEEDSAAAQNSIGGVFSSSNLVSAGLAVSSPASMQFGVDFSYGLTPNTITGATTKSLLFVGGSANQTVHGGDAGNLFYAGGGSDTIYGGSRGDRFISGSGNSSFFGGSGNDTFVGGTGGNVIAGNGGTNTLDYSWFIDPVTVNIKTGQTLKVSPNSDTFSNIQVFLLGTSNDTVVAGAGSHTLNGGAGTNTLDYTGATSGVNVNLLTGVVANNGYGAQDSISNFQNVTVTTSGSILHAGTVGGTLRATGNFDTLTGQTSDTLVVVGSGNTLTAGSGSSTLNATGGSNKLTGGAGNDTLSVSGGGSNTMDGGAGINTLDYSGWNSAVTLNLKTGQAVNAVGTDIFSNIQSFLLGVGNDTVVAGTGSHTLNGGGGSNTLDFTAATVGINANLLTGVVANNGYGAQDTVSNFQNVTVTIGGSILHAGASPGTLRATGNFDTLTGQTSDTLVVVGSGNTLVAGSGNSTLNATGGSNKLTGGAGNDTIIVSGGASNTIDGGTGVNTLDYTAWSSNVTLNLKTGQAINVLGTDSFTNIQTFKLGNGNETVVGGTGGHTVTGGNGNNTLDYTGATSGVNANLLTGVVANNGYGAQDTVSNFQNVTVTTSGSILHAGARAGTLRATGNFDALTGQTSDTLVVVGSGNTLTAGSGSSTLNATGGSNKLTGGAGNDMIIVSGGASNTIDGGTGVNTLDYTAWSSNVTLNLKTGQAVNVLGTDTFSNIQAFLLGAGNNTVMAGAGGHTVTGGSGNNTLDYTGATSGVNVNLLTGVVANNGYGFQDSISNFQNVTVTTSGSIVHAGSKGGTLRATGNFDTLTGQTSDTLVVVGSGNTLTAGSGSSTLNATGGSNKLTGGAGKDTIIVSGGGSNTIDGGAGTDTLDYTGWGSPITVNLKTGQAINVVGTDTFSNIETFLLGAGNDTVVAGTGSYMLNGGGGSNTLDYTGATSGVNVNMLTGVVANNGYGAQDSISNFQNVIVTASGSILHAGSVGGTLRATGNFDTLTGQTSDTLIVVGSGDTLVAGSGSSTLNATGGSNKLTGGGGNDTLSVSGGASNTLDGGAGANTLDYQGWASNVMLNLGTGQAVNLLGTDTFSNIQTFFLGAGNDTVAAGAGSHTLNGGGGSNTLDYAGATAGVNVNLLTGVVANNGYGAQDTVSNFQNVIATTSGSILHAGAVGSTLRATGNFEALTGQSSDTLIVIGSGNILTAGSGNSTLNATGGSNKLTGGAGNDTIIVSGGASNTIDGGTGVNTLDYTAWSSSVTLNLKTGQAVNVLGTDTFANIQTFLLGNGNETVVAGVGGHTVTAGSGNNMLDYTGATSGVNVNLLTGVVANNGYGAQDSVSNFQNVTVATSGSILHAGAKAGTLRATGNFDTLTGQTSDTLVVVGSGNTLTAGSGSSTLNATGGSNKLTGGKGNDTISVSGGGSNTIDGGTGINTLDYQGWSSNVTLNLGAGQAVNAVGTDTFSNIQTFLLGNGNDTVVAGVGDHTVTGGSGNNTLDYTGATSGVNVNLLTGVVANNGYGFQDSISNFQNVTVTTSGSIVHAGSKGGTLRATGNFDTLTGQTSDTLVVVGSGNTLTAGSGSSTLNATGGSNKLTGGAGNDTLSVSGGGSNTIDGGSGTNTLDYQGWSSNVTLNLGTGQVINAAGTDTFSNIQTFVLGAGNDTVVGGAGYHTLNGGSGIDTLVYSNNGATVNANLLTGVVANNGSNGQDTVSNFENLTVTGDGAALHAGANSGVLTLTGNYGRLTGQTRDIITAIGDRNQLVAGFGDSTLTDTGSFNILTGGAGNNAITDNGNFNTLTGGGGSSTLTVRGDWNTVTAGNGGSLLGATGNWNTLQGGAGNDVLTAGGGGSNTLDGGAGNDTLTGGAAKATYVYGDGYGSDTITDFTAGPEHYLLLQAMSAFHSFADVQAHWSQNGNDVVIANPNGGQLTLQSTTTTDLTAHQDVILFA
jgi:Ca2+-binding RTX toxin-like protein